MCSPEVAKIVHDRFQKEGRPTFSRRSFLRFGGLTISGLAAATLAPKGIASAKSPVEAVVDMSHVFATTVPTYTPGEEPVRETFVTVKENGFYIQKWNLYEHSGTHVDFPAHFIDGAETVDVYDAAKLVATAVVIDISAKAAADANAMLDVADIEAHEAANGAIPEGALVCMYSGWESKWNDVPAFRGDVGDGKLNFPGFSGEAVKWLVENRNIRGIAVDTLSLDPGNSATFDAHYATLGAGCYGIENIANLKEIMGKAATVIVGIPRWEAGSGGPARILALA